MNFQVIFSDSLALDGTAIQKNIVITYKNNVNSVDVNLLIYLPSKLDRPAPLFLGMNFYGNHTIHPDESILINRNFVRNKPEYNIFNNSADERSRGVCAHRWPVETILERGYGIATIYYGDLDPDFDDGFKNGIHSLVNKSNNPNQEQHSSISAWSYGLSSAMDYFELDKDINHNKVVVFGHSRLGKTALWAGALDERFSIVISNNSGCGGAALSRRKAGETVEKINISFPHWFSKNFHSFNNRESELPIDQHMLVSLIAPRPVYVASAELDTWADPEGEYLSLFHAGKVYKLYGLVFFEKEKMPQLNKPVWKGNMGYHIRSGKHDITLYDWEKYLDFTDLHFKNVD